jgi:putative membrane-bound dehydrogenase-like protein
MGTWFRHAKRALLLALSLPGIATADSPSDAVKRFKVADGLEISLFASEPDIRQPVAIHYDERGRLWVVQYLQYPNPAGLKKVRVDQFLRTVFDRVPEPPPHGPKGADRITICEDTDGDGRADKFKDFVAGLNMATGVAVGYGGVFVAQSPYLLFYPDRNRDDVPDGDPEVCVAGFGMEDSHAYPNSLQIGPDGWLYGAQGSNVWAKVKVEVRANGQTYAVTGENRKSEIGNRKVGDGSSPTSDLRSPISELAFNQCIWRYHPPTRRFEVFAEGGGNTWGLDFDRHGQIIAGTNFGGVCGLHMVQGAYYVKGFAKHGPLSNPHAYGYFEHMPYASPARISQGEHVMCGGIVYQGGAMGPEIENQYVTCALLHRAIYWHKLIPDRSTFKSDFGGTLLSSDDPEFRPVDLTIGPDGAIYIADWCDVRANHVLPEDTWNKTNGRVYRLALAKKDKRIEYDTEECLAHFEGELDDDIAQRLQTTSNVFWRRAAVQWLGERAGKLGHYITSHFNLMLHRADRPTAVYGLWGLYRTGKLDEARSLELLGHANAEVRAWVVRLLGDERKVSRGIARRFVELAKSDPSAVVRGQLASTAARLPGGDALAILRALAARSEDADDPYIPLLVWWAIEKQAIGSRAGVVAWFDDSAWWALPMVRKHLAERVARRFAAEGTSEGFAACARLLAKAPTADDVQRVARGAEQALSGRPLDRPPAELEAAIRPLFQRDGKNATLLRFALKLGSQDAYATALEVIADRRAPEAQRIDLIELVGQSRRPGVVELLLGELAAKPSEPIANAILTALAHFDDSRIAAAAIASHSALSPNVRRRAVSMLAARRAWAAALLEAVAAKKIPAAEITADLAGTIQLHGDAALDALLERHVGRFNVQSSQEKAEAAVGISRILARGHGDAPRGKPLFAKHCGTCHTLFGEGNRIGPDLTTADRANRELMLTSIVDPSLAIRQEYAASTVLTDDGQVLTGIVVESTPASITLVDAKNQKTTIERTRIDQLKPAAQSLMPEKILDPLSQRELLDLFAYLETGVKAVARPSQLTSAFDRDAEDWLLEDNGQVIKPEHQLTEGNPGGFVLVRDAAGGDVRAVAPQKFLGDLSRFANGNAWFDARRLDESSAGKPHPMFGVLTITDGRRTLKQDLFHPTIRAPGRPWTRFSGRITAEAFGTDADTFKSVLANVTRVTVTLEALADAQETIAFDNFALSATK